MSTLAKKQEGSIDRDASEAALRAAIERCGLRLHRIVGGPSMVSSTGDEAFTVIVHMPRAVLSSPPAAGKPRVGSRVRWTSGAAGRLVPKTGTVEAVLAPGESPHGIREPGLPRDHESYLVRADNGRLYWPRVAGLEVVSP